MNKMNQSKSRSSEMKALGGGVTIFHLEHNQKICLMVL